MKRKNGEIGSFFEFPYFDCVNPTESVLYNLIHSSGKNTYIFVQDGRQAIKAVLQQIRNVHEKNVIFRHISVIQSFSPSKRWD